MNNSKEYTPRQSIREALFKNNEHCIYCNCHLSIDSINSPSFATIEHLTPKSEKGSDSLDNLSLACKLCNSTIRSSRSQFIGIEFQDKQYKHSANNLKLLQTILVYKNQEVIITNILNFIQNDQIEEAFLFIKKEVDYVMRKSFLLTIKNYISRILNTVESILLQVKYITDFLNGLLKNAKYKQNELLNQSPKIHFIKIQCTNNTITKELL